MRLLRQTLASCAVLLAVVLTGCAADTATPSAPTAATATTLSTTGVSGLPTVALGTLPPQAQQTYDVILAGGPYPYPQDDGTFGNREGTLPAQDYGWYREYTVETPGSRDRGARRFVVGEDGVFFYTDDHYDTFREVLE